MSYFAAAVARVDGGWTAGEVSLRGVTDIEEVADRLRDAVRPSDLVARMGGDEFAVILTRLRGMADLDAVLARMTARLHTSLRHGGRDIDCRVSMGVAMFPDMPATSAT